MPDLLLLLDYGPDLFGCRRRGVVRIVVLVRGHGGALVRDQARGREGLGPM